jgi:pilus assembly protein CpaF
MSHVAIHAQALANLLSPVACHLDDPEVSELLINGPTEIYVERRGRLQRTSASFASLDALRALVTGIAQFCGRIVDAADPIVEGRLPDGSRVQIVLPPASRVGPCIAIRRFSRRALTVPTLIDKGTLTLDAAAALSLLVGFGCNVLVAGGTGSGKTSLLNALSSFIPTEQRVVVIEDASELQLQLPHVVALEAHPGDARGRGRVSMGDLFRASLRLRPDRIVIGEIRGAEALDLVQAMSSGHGGCLSTLHASHPIDALHRLETMALMSPVGLPLSALRAQIVSAVDVIVQAERDREGQRRITQIAEVVPTTHAYRVAPLFEHRAGALVPTGQLPRCAKRIHEQGERFPACMYEASHAQR